MSSKYARFVLGASKVSQRGSVVVPKPIRVALEIKEGDRLIWMIEVREKDAPEAIVRKEGGGLKQK